MTISDQIAGWAANLRLIDVPEDVRNIARRCLIDTVGVIVAGTAANPGRRARAVAEDLYGKGPCEVPGTSLELSAAGAALICGTASHALDFDDTSYTGIMHGSAVSLPAVLGAGQQAGRSGADFLTDFIVALEATYAIAMMCSTRQYYDGWWTSGTFGMPGATAGTGRAYGLDADQISQAIGIATVQASGMKAMFGTDTKPYLAGRSAAVCVESAAAVSHGMTGPVVGFEENRGYLNLINHGDADLGELDKLGQVWRLKEPGILFKQYPICSAAHAGAELAGRLVADNGIDVAQIEAIRCDVPEVVDVSLVYNDPQTPQEAQFSMPFAVACMLTHGRIAPEHLDAKLLKDGAFRQMMQRVSMHRDDGLSGDPATPEGAQVTIALADGRKVSDFLAEPTGMPGNPMTDEQLEAKFLACCDFGGAARAWSEPLLDALRSIEDRPSIRGLFA